MKTEEENTSFAIKNVDKYNEIWNKIKEKLNIKFHSTSVYDEKYMKANIKEFNSAIKTNVLGNKIPNEDVHYTCIACITVMRMGKKLSIGLFRTV